MGILGGQLVVTMVMASFLHKVAPIYSLGRWLLCGGSLRRYEHPSNEELQQLATGGGGGATTKSASSKRKGAKYDQRRGGSNGLAAAADSKEFTVPRSSLDVELRAAPISPLTAPALRFYPDYQWLVDFSLCTVVVYLITEAYSSFVHVEGELNLGSVWSVLLCFYALKCLIAVSAIFWSRESSGELVMCFLFGFFFLVLSMAVLVTSDELLDLGIESAYSNFSAEATKFLHEQDISSVGPASLLVFRTTLAVISALIGALLTFPGFRWAKTYMASVAAPSTRSAMKLLLHVELGLPLMTALLWVTPIVRNVSARVPWVTAARMDVLRAAALLAFVALRVANVRTHLQAYLDTAVLRVRQLRKEAGRISNTELQRSVAQIYYYVCVVALQCIAPLLLLLSLTLLLKLLGGLRWSHLLLDAEPTTTDVGGSAAAAAGVIAGLPPGHGLGSATDPAAGNVAADVAHVTLTLARLRAVFSTALYRSLLQYLTWWTLLAWVATTLFGLMYNMYIIE